MAYDIGSYVDLTYLNKRKPNQQRSGSKAGNFLVEIGTQFKFYLTESGLQTRRVISVAAV